jgi:hypothetical protein
LPLAFSVQQDATGARQFEQRYGLHDLTVPLAQFIALAPPAARAYVTENEINMRAFPPLADAMVIFGGGYVINRPRHRPAAGLRAGLLGRYRYPWLAILDRLRACHVRLEQERIAHGWVITSSTSDAVRRPGTKSGTIEAMNVANKVKVGK